MRTARLQRRKAGSNCLHSALPTNPIHKLGLHRIGSHNTDSIWRDCRTSRWGISGVYRFVHAPSWSEKTATVLGTASGAVLSSRDFSASPQNCFYKTAKIPTGLRNSAQQKLLVFTSSEPAYSSFSDRVRMQTSNFFYYSPHFQWSPTAAGKDSATAPTLLSCDRHYQHGEALAGFGNSTIWWLQIGRKMQYSSQSPVHRVFGGLPDQRLRLLESLMQLPALWWVLLPHFFINHVCATQS